MRVVIFGLGYVGFTAGCCIASQGHQVVGIDVNPSKVTAVNTGRSPIIEPEVGKMLEQAHTAGNFIADHKIRDHLRGADLALVCVGTPSTATGEHHMGYIADVSRQIAEALQDSDHRLTVAYRSTIRPGTVEDLIRPIFENANVLDKVDLVYNPEFLREGSAVRDYFAPPKIVVGTADGQPNDTMNALNADIVAPVFHVGYREAEITKFIDNTWHAVKVAFANEIGRVCLRSGVSARQAHEIFISDTKLNISPSYTRPGGAFGGSCLPKDVRALQYIGADTGANLHLVDSLLRSNEAHKHALFEYAVEGLPQGAKVLIAGLAFKAGTDDLRESPNVDLARKLLSAGFVVEIFDPSIDANMLVGANLGYAYSHLPMIKRLLISKDRAEAGEYDRIIAANATVADLALQDQSKLRDLASLP